MFIRTTLDHPEASCGNMGLRVRALVLPVAVLNRGPSGSPAMQRDVYIEGLLQLVATRKLMLIAFLRPGIWNTVLHSYKSLTKGTAAADRHTTHSVWRLNLRLHLLHPAVLLSCDFIAAQIPVRSRRPRVGFGRYRVPLSA